MEMLRLAADLLHVDAPLPWDVYDSAGHLLLCKGFVLEQDSQIESLLERGMFVDAAEYQAHKRAQAAAPAEELDPFWLWETIPRSLSRLLRGIEQESAFPEKIGALAAQILRLCEQNADAALAAIILLEKNKYSIIHSLHVAALGDILARSMSWAYERRRSLACSALTMNIGMLELQSILATQKDPPSPEQRAGIAQHPAKGVEILRRAGVQDETWLTAVLQHHESPDGTGYPSSICDMSEEAQILRTADIFSAKVAPRATRKAMDANQAAKALFVAEGQHKNALGGLLVKCVGIFPPGTFVKLHCGETAVVFKRGVSANAPIVFSFVNGKGVPMLEPVKRDCTRPEYAVAAVVPQDNVLIGLDLGRIWKSAKSQ